MGKMTRKPDYDTPPPVPKGHGKYPRHEPTPALRKRVFELAEVGVTHADIAIAIGLRDDNVLRRCYRNELYEGRIGANAAVGRRLFDKAKDGDTIACIFWLKSQAGWKDRPDVSGDAGQQNRPINIKINFIKGPGTKELTYSANVENSNS